ncbi:MAG: hypothetical protein CMM75_07485 [Rhodospirillaceae bacterium]|mgnify:CR=1 FL=1|nr:hypothetical protein [Rhodospirillaceae bacterium]
MCLGGLQDMSDNPTVGEIFVSFLEECGVRAAFGVISIHNMPFLDAIGVRKKIRFVAARSEAGAVNMADAYARVGPQLGVAFTSTGTAAGNAAGAMIEAQTAGTPLLHITGQIETNHLDQMHGYIHEAQDQLTMLKSVSKSAYRVEEPESALEMLKMAVRDALSAPSGPVSIEVPIDIQHSKIPWPQNRSPFLIETIKPDIETLNRLVSCLSLAKRPMLWLGGGARHAEKAVQKLVSLGFGVVTSTQGRGIISENHPASLGAYNLYSPVEEFFDSCDAMLVVGSRLRSNETLKYGLRLPRPLYQIDVDQRAAANRPYIPEVFIKGDSALSLKFIGERLDGKMNIDPNFRIKLGEARTAAEKLLNDGLGPYSVLVQDIKGTVKEDLVWVRDVTVSNSTWGNRAVPLNGPFNGVHAVGGGIGQSIQMAIGAAIARPDRQVVCLAGDGGLQVNIGEMATATQEGVNIVLILMNSHDYEVIKNIQDSQFGGRRFYSDIYTPKFSAVANSTNWNYEKITDLRLFQNTLASALKKNKCTLIEIDMSAIGSFSKLFGGPPVKKGS